jgi:low affinity Fe/Cu permease
MSQQKNTFTRFANWAASAAGYPKTFAGAILIIVVWAISGPVFGFSDTWQLVINTGTTIITFLMVFVIQNSQNRDSRAMQIKLDEIIRAMEGAHNALLDLEELTEKDLDRIRKSYTQLAALAREELAKGHVDTDKPEVSLR